MQSPRQLIFVFSTESLFASSSAVLIRTLDLWLGFVPGEGNGTLSEIALNFVGFMFLMTVPNTVHAGILFSLYAWR